MDIIEILEEITTTFFSWCSMIVNKIGTSYVLLLPFVLGFVNRIITLLKKIMGRR